MSKKEDPTHTRKMDQHDIRRHHENTPLFATEEDLFGIFFIANFWGHRESFVVAAWTFPRDVDGETKLAISMCTFRKQTQRSERQ
jgi:hypothetical protein